MVLSCSLPGVVGWSDGWKQVSIKSILDPVLTDVEVVIEQSAYISGINFTFEGQPLLIVQMFQSLPVQ